MTAAVLVFVLVGITIAVAALVVVPRIGSSRIVFGNVPDRPKPFGYRMSWIAIKSTRTSEIAAHLGLTDATPANWNSGIGTIYDNQLSDTYVFVTPPVKGWTFVAGLPLPHPWGTSFADKLTPMLLNLSKTFGEAHYFAAFPIIDFFGWARFHNGRLIRGFVIGDEGIIWDRGRLTPEEKTLGLKFYDLRGIKDRKGDAGGAIVLYPTEDQVLRLAAGWGIAPLRLDKLAVEPALGIIARAPGNWRSERLKKAA